MILVNNAKMACMKCIRGHRSSSCKHDDRELFPIRPRGRPVSQCEKCRQARVMRHIHVKCTCSSNAEKPQSQIKKSRNKPSERDSTLSVSSKPAPSSSSCCKGHHSHTSLPSQTSFDSKVQEHNFFSHPSSESPDGSGSLFVPNHHPYHYPSGAGLYSHPENTQCLCKDCHPCNYQISSPHWYSHCHNDPMYANVPPFRNPNIHADDASRLHLEMNKFHPFSLGQRRKIIPNFPTPSALKVLSNSQDSIAAAAASHDLYPQPEFPYPFAMLDNGSYVPLSPNQPSRSPIYPPPDPLDGVKSESNSNIPFHNFPIQLSDYFTLPSNCAQGSTHCQCDDDCQCLGCLTHPNNPTTLAALNHISALQEDHREPVLSHPSTEEKLLLDGFDDDLPDNSSNQYIPDNQYGIQYPVHNFRFTPEIS
ncbi:nutritional copper sensing transcription factor Cuf1 [Schizosaccharomyces cryophilus OY26]|uniref:Nutritional copper sensing transcription factor Cuf1 n=1 Tax=Schizosaccharomyces cryophilus (strain OY26 / ATCC MYA-4695 / CBS 11777 / NBRC 106824 / NRRL Y48691) TaxID=653667 RepID=S9X7D3_SCHCR|nr:nutritional copper sensing transcription factor Cuf1 [Schizosaccharomyces cryophilus OY26]EPY49686.1 nutritional copper sensing transcription factor Cuf1 [Schizosaccharomyces cryophilus OY26]